MTETKSTLNMSFEEALAELEQIVKKIDSGQESLEFAVASFERGAELKNHCEQKLKEAQLKIEKIVKGNDGEIKTEPVEF